MFQAPLHLPRPFQTYLLPSFPFRHRRHSSTTSTTSTTSDNSTTSTASTASSISPPQPNYLSTHPPTSTISCSRCHAHLALTTQIISKGFTGRHGRAYLVSPSPSNPYSSLLHPSSSSSSPTQKSGKHTTPAGMLPNTYTHKPVPRNLVTGAHTVSDVCCALCGSVVGWKYVGASEESQRYKVGKFILETKRVVVGAVWDELGEKVEYRGGGARDGDGKGEGREEVVFDSQDEDECEDLFAGTWSAGMARRRRARRLGLRT